MSSTALEYPVNIRIDLKTERSVESFPGLRIKVHTGGPPHMSEGSFLTLVARPPFVRIRRDGPLWRSVQPPLGVNLTQGHPYPYFIWQVSKDLIWLASAVSSTSSSASRQTTIQNRVSASNFFLNFHSVSWNCCFCSGLQTLMFSLL